MEYYPDLDENDEVEEEAIIRKLPPEGNTNAQNVFDTIFCNRESMDINMNRNRADFRNGMSNHLTFLNSIKSLFLSLDHLLDLMNVSHQAIGAEHIFVTEDFKVKLGGFGRAETFENDNNQVTGYHYCRNLKQLGLFIQTLYNFLFGETRGEIRILEEDPLPDNLGLQDLDYFNNAYNNQAEISKRGYQHEISSDEGLSHFVTSILEDINTVSQADATDRFSQILEELVTACNDYESKLNVVAEELFSS